MATIGFRHYPAPTPPAPDSDPIIACSGDLAGESLEPQAELVRSLPRPFVQLNERRVGRLRIVMLVRSGEGRASWRG